MADKKNMCFEQIEIQYVCEVEQRHIVGLGYESCEFFEPNEKGIVSENYGKTFKTIVCKHLYFKECLCSQARAAAKKQRNES